MNVRIICKLALIIMIGVLAACSDKYKVQERIQNLEQSITYYTVTLRWAQYQSAYNYHLSPSGTQPPVDLEKLREISVTGIDITEKELSEGQTEAQVRGVIRYFNKNQGTEKRVNLDQIWWYNEENKRWFIGSEFPKFE